MYYDIKSGKIQKYFSRSASIPILISPQRSYFIAPPQFNQTSISEIRNVIIIPRNVVVDENLPTKIMTDIIEWDPLERRIYSLNLKTKILSIIDTKTLQKEKVKIRGMGNYEILRIKAVKNPDKLFLVATNFNLPDKEKQTNVYLLDLADKIKSVKLFLSDINSFDISPMGIAVYSKVYGTTEIAGEGTIYDRNPAKRYVSINLVDERHKEKNIKRLHFDPWPGVTGAGVLKQKPIMTKDGLSLAFIVKSRDSANESRYKLNMLSIR